MNIIIIHMGTVSECFCSTGLISAVAKNGEVEVVVGDPSCIDVFKYNKNVKKCRLIGEFLSRSKNQKYDLLINLHPSFSDDIYNINAERKIGFNYSEDSEKYNSYLYGNRKTKQNIFQIYFRLSGLKWDGEGFDFCYYPKNKTHKDRTGLVILNRNLREYMIEKLQLTHSRLWHVPFRKNLFKKIDEINYCKNIITDDFLSMNIALAYRKKIYFLKTHDYNFSIETFGNGSVYEVSKNIIL